MQQGKEVKLDMTLRRCNLLFQLPQMSHGAGQAGSLGCAFGGPVLRKERAVSSSRWRPSNLAYVKKLQKHLLFLKAAVLEGPTIKPHVKYLEKQLRH